MFKDELDAIFLGFGINTLAMAYECASQNRSVMIIHDDVDEKLLNTQFPYYIWDEYLDSRPFLKGARKNKISELAWKGNEKTLKFEISQCWKLNSPKIIPLLKKQLKNYNVSIIKSSEIKLDFHKNVQVKTDGDKFTAPFCVADMNLKNKIDTKMGLDALKKPRARSNMYTTIENVKGFPISTDDININNIIVETPGFNPKFQTKIVSNSIFPVHESEVILSLKWINENSEFGGSKFLYLNELWLKNWKRKRNEHFISNELIDIPIEFYNFKDFLPNSRLMLIDAHHDQLNCNFLGHDISKSFKLAEIFTFWLDASIRQDNFDIASMEFYMLNPEDASLSYDLNKNARFREQFMNIISTLESEKVDDFISTFMKKLTRPKFLLFLKGTLPNNIIDKILNDLNT